MSRSASWLSGRRRRSPLADAPADAKIVLHVGSGPLRPERLHPRYRESGWWEVRLDIEPGCRPDIVADIVDMPEVASASVDAVWSCHNIEHVFAHEVPKVLSEFHRVLRSDGEVLITTPDLQRAAERIASGRLEDQMYRAPAGPITPLDMVYGHGRQVARGSVHMAHRTGFTSRTLERKLRDAGFEQVKVRREAGDFSLWADARRGRTAA